MKVLKKILALVCFSFILCNVFSCSSKEVKNDISSVAKNESESVNQNKKTIKVVSTIFPIYDIVRNVVPNENYELTLLLDSGIDIHNFSPTAKDILKIGEADLFIHIGGESDKWVDRTIESSQNKQIKTVNLMNELAAFVKEEEIVEGMQHEHEEHEDETHDEHEGETHEEGEEHDHEEHENDEHIWLSIRNTKEMTRAIAKKLIETDSENQSRIQENANAFIEKLDALDKKYVEVSQNKKYDTILFGDRFPFRYLVDDYGLKYFAAFSGCSAEAEASFEIVAFLANKLDELNLKHICALKGAEPRIAKTIVTTSKNKDRDIVLFNSMEGITNVNDAENTNYIKIMEENLEALKSAIN
ncbi:MAG: zinc ABC transporter substrate-binding protein [Lachnospiraceae bacterium]|nr:zinc ABC transporter substrate-binding protein [Lachnospiraceae bacterium]